MCCLISPTTHACHHHPSETCPVVACPRLLSCEVGDQITVEDTVTVLSQGRSHPGEGTTSVLTAGLQVLGGASGLIEAEPVVLHPHCDNTIVCLPPRDLVHHTEVTTVVAQAVVVGGLTHQLLEGGIDDQGHGPSLPPEGEDPEDLEAILLLNALASILAVSPLHLQGVDAHDYQDLLKDEGVTTALYDLEVEGVEVERDLVVHLQELYQSPPLSQKVKKI